MGLRILHAADWHLDSPLTSLPEPAADTLRQALRQLPGRIADLCRERECDLVLLAGDLFDGKPSRETVELVKRALSRCAVPVYIAPGNHDFYSAESPWEEEWPENVHIFRGELTYFDEPGLDCRIYGGGYRSMDCPPLLEGFRAEGDTGYCLGVLHGDPIQLASPCCPVTAAQVRESGLNYLALGHIHRSGSFRAGDTLCAWPGCPMGRGWDETGEKGVLIAEIGSRTRVEFVPLGLPEFRVLTQEITGDGLTELEAVLPPVDDGCLYRVTLTGQASPDLAEIRQHFSHLTYLELRDETRLPVDIWASAGEDSLRGVYFQLLSRQLEQADEEQKKIIKLAGEISARLLEGREVVLP